MEKKKRKASRGKKQIKKQILMFIPNVWLPVHMGKSFETEYSIRSAHCGPCNVQWFYLVKHEHGFSEHEPIKCETCKGDLWRGQGLPSGFSASSEPEVIACLLEHPEKKKTLVLAYIQSNLEQAKSSLLCHLLRHDFSGLYEAVTVMEGGLNFPTKLKRSSRKKAFSSLKLLNTIEIENNKEKKEDYITRLFKKTEDERTKEKELDRLRRLKFSASAKNALKKLKNVTASSLSNYKKFKKKSINLPQPSQKENFQTVLDNLKKLPKLFPKPFKGGLASKRFPSSFRSKFSTLLQKERRRQAAGSTKKIGVTTKKDSE